MNPCSATTDVLKVISRSTFDLQSVLDTLTTSAARLCEAELAGIARQKGDAYYYAATFGYPAEVDQYLRSITHQPGTGSTIGLTLAARRTIHIHDVLADPNYKMPDVALRAGLRTALGVPLLREGAPIGVFVLGRKDVRPFTDAQIGQVSTFADQAVIAIENVRLFDEVQARSRELSESLEQQTATSKVLEVISRSTFDLQTVLDTLTESAARLCEAEMAGIVRPKGAAYSWATSYGFPPTSWNTLRTFR